MKSKKKIKILLVSTPVKYGVAKYLESIIKVLDRRNFIIEVAAPLKRTSSGSALDFFELLNSLNIPIHYVNLRREINFINDLFCLFRLYRIIKKGRYDILHLHSSKAGFLGRIAGRIAGSRTIYTPHAFYFMKWPKSLKRFFYLLLEKFAGLFTNYLIASSYPEKDVAVQNKIINSSRIFVIPLAIDTQKYRPDSMHRQKTKSDLAIPLDAKVIGTSARMDSQKDPLTLIRASALVAKETADLYFVWCGDGPMYNQIKELAQELGILPKWRFVGFVNFKRLHEIMNIFDIFVLTSLFESGPYSVLEAMIFNIPVIASDVVGNNFILADNRGILVPPGNPARFTRTIKMLLQHKDRCQTMRYRAKQFVIDNYSIIDFADKYNDIYKKLSAPI